MLGIIQLAGGEDRRRTLTPLALRERYSALSESGLGKTQRLHAVGAHTGALSECCIPCFLWLLLNLCMALIELWMPSPVLDSSLCHAEPIVINHRQLCGVRASLRPPKE